MKVNRWMLPLLAIILLVALVAASYPAGWWASTGRAVAGSGRTAPGQGMGEGMGEGAGGETLKGWMSLQDASELTGLPVIRLAELAGAPDPAAIEPTTPLNTLEGQIPGFTMVDFRAAVAAATG